MQLVRDGGPPLYRQICTSVRYQIARGALKPGDSLPAIRTAERDWGVSRHTVRRAYAELASEGLVVTHHGSGTRVSPVFDPDYLSSADKPAELAARAAAVAMDRFGLDRDDLAKLLLRRSYRPQVFITECSAVLAETLAVQVEQAWEVDTCPIVLDEDVSIPTGEILATFYHVGELRDLLGTRISEAAFLPVELDPDYHSALKALEASATPAVLCGLSELSLQAMAADIRRCAPDIDLTISTVRPGSVLADARRDGKRLIFSPQTWDQMSWCARQGDVLLHASRFDPRALCAIARRRGWQPVQDASSSTPV